MKSLLVILMVALGFAWAGAQPVCDTLWARTYPEYHPSQPEALLPSFNGGLIWTGTWLYHADTLNGHSDLLTAETDGLGNPRWTFRVEGVTDDTIWSARSLCRTADSCYLVLATRHYEGTPDVVVFKLDRNGAEVWRHNYRLSATWNAATSIAAHEDNTALFSMTATLHNDTFNVDVPTTVLVKLNGNGDTLWTHQIYFEPGRIIPVSDGWMMLSKSTYPTLLKLDQEGHRLLLREYYDVSIGDFEDLVETPSGYFITATSRAYGADNFSLLHVGLDGEPITIRNFIPDEGYEERVVGIVKTADGGMMLGGEAFQPDSYLNNIMLMIKVDSLGARQWRASFRTGWQSGVTAFCAMPDGGFAMGGCAITVPGQGGYSDCMLVRIGAPEANPVDVRTTTPGELRLEANYPNPFNPTTQIVFNLPRTMRVRLAVYNVLGEEVARLADNVMSAGHHVMTFEAANLPSGVYYTRLDAAGAALTQKMLLVK